MRRWTSWRQDDKARTRTEHPTQNGKNRPQTPLARMMPFPASTRRDPLITDLSCGTNQRSHRVASAATTTTLVPAWFEASDTVLTQTRRQNSPSSRALYIRVLLIDGKNLLGCQSSKDIGRSMGRVTSHRQETQCGSWSDRASMGVARMRSILARA
jgi:hypothetical protein